MTLHEVVIHNRGPALWPDHKPLDEVLELQRSTPELVWEGTYQGRPTPPGGFIFKRDWWRNSNRYDPSHPDRPTAWGRYISWDTALKDDPKNDTDYSSFTVGDLWPDYRLAVTFSLSQRMEFPELSDAITYWGKEYNRDGLLNAILIEDKASGTSAIQTLQRMADPEIAPLIVPFVPTTDKVTRAKQASVYCKRDCVQFPIPGLSVPWLPDFEQELFSFPQGAHDDRVDSFSQLILYIENLLDYGYHARRGNKQ